MCCLLPPPNTTIYIGCPHAKDPMSIESGTGGPPPKSTFKSCDGKKYKRDHLGNIPDEFGKDYQRITNAPRTLSMANTGDPNSGGSQFFINVNHNSFLDWFDTSTESKHPVFGKVRFCMWVVTCLCDSSIPSSGFSNLFDQREISLVWGSSNHQRPFLDYRRL